MRSQARTDEVATAPMISVLVIPLLPEDRELASCTHFLIPADSEDIAAYLRRILLAEYAWNLEKDAFLGHIYADAVFKVLAGKLRRQLETTMQLLFRSAFPGVLAQENARALLRRGGCLRAG